MTNEFGKVVDLEPGVISEFQIEKIHLVNKSETGTGHGVRASLPVKSFPGSFSGIKFEMNHNPMVF